MTDNDDDRAMARIFDRAFASVSVPSLEAIRRGRSRRVGTLLPAAFALVTVIVIAGLIGGWLGGRRVPAATPTSLDCGSPTALAPHPRASSLTGAPLGPVLIRGYYAQAATTAVVQGFTLGYPTKMLVLIARDMDVDVTLTGARCSDGQPLRFWMGPGRSDTPFPQADLPVSEARMATTGQLDPTLQALRLPTTAGVIDYGGYMLFPSAGTYRIEGFANGGKIGDVTLLVTSDVPPAAAPTITPCPVTTTRDTSGVVASSGDIGLLETRPASFPGEKLVVLVRRGGAIGESLEVHATALGPRGGGEVIWSNPPSARTTSWGTVAYEVNTKPLGNVGCWRIARSDAPASDPGIVIDLGSSATELTAAQVIDVDGYQVSAQLLFDRAYGLRAADTARTSGLEGVGLACTWIRAGPDVPDATEVFGSPGAPAELARWTPLTTGTRGGRTGGFPLAASQDPVATDVVCGLRDGSGDHGVDVFVWFTRASGTTMVRALSLIPWRH